MVPSEIERIGHKTHDPAEAEAWDRAQRMQLSVEERQKIARALRDRAFGTAPPDVRQARDA
ncbi:MAG: hypothetical protein EXR75_07335 [Myxococcales bacterium]|nr:hypothetical protein [Myxococcales bacterium]